MGTIAIQLAKLRSLASSQETPNHFVGYAAKEEGIGLREVLGRVTMQVFVCQHCTMIAAPVQCDVDGIPKGAHYVRIPPIG